MSILTVTVELVPVGMGQSSVVMRPQTATTFGPMLTVGLGLLVSGLLLAQPSARSPRPAQASAGVAAEPLAHEAPHATLFSFGH